MDSVIIKPVETKQEMNQFIKVPFEIYKGDESWISPLILERKEHFSKKNPFFEHAKVQFFLLSKMVNALEGLLPILTTYISNNITKSVDSLDLLKG